MNRRALIAAAGGTVVLAGLAAGAWRRWGSPPPAPVPDPVDAGLLSPGLKAIVPPLQLGDVAFEDADGKTVRIADFKGRPVLLNIWAKWCAPCITELPTLNKLQDSTAPGTLAVLAVAVDEPDPAKVRNFLANRGLTALHPYLDPKSNFAKVLAIKQIPVSVLIDRDGYGLVRADAPADWFGKAAIDLLKKTIL